MGSVPILILGLLLLTSAPAIASYTVTPETWNIIGLDSNTPASGPNRFPVGAKVCGGTPSSTDTAVFTWDTATGPDPIATYDNAGAYIYLRSGSANPVSITFGADGCADAYFEVEVNKTSAAFDLKRRYHITAGGVSTTMPRELYVEHLVSQSRNGIDNIKLNGVSIPAGGSMNLMVGNTYTIELDGHTAPGGYNQFEEFINFPNTIFQIQSVSTTYTMNSSPYVPNPNPKLYADACRWENDPNSPYYRSCWEAWKSGDTVITTYTVKILSGGGTTQTLNSLLYDFSGSSFHYNADYSTGMRFANIIDPAATTISKSFFPNPTNAGGVTTLSFTLTNPNAGAVSGLNFIDVFPTSPGAMTLNSTTTTTNTCGGTLTDNVGGALAVGSAGIKLTSAAIPANSSCIVAVDVTIPTTGTYTNTSNHLFVDALDTGKYATTTLTVNSTPPPPPVSSACAVPVQLAAWTMPTAGQGSGGPPPPYTTKAADVATATASYVTVSGAQSIGNGNPANAWGGTAPTGGSGWSETASSMNNYFQFVLDTSNYGGVTVTYDGNPFSAGNWGNPKSNVFINTSANGGAFTAYTPVQQAPKNAWTTGLTATAATTGTSTTTFRFGVDGASKPAATFYLDNIVFTGCTRPDPTKLTIMKSFSPSPVAVNGTSTLTFTISNSNAASTASLTNISFTDVLPLQNLQGTVAVTNGSPTVTGTGTAFKTQLAATSIVSISGVFYTVSSISSDTVLTLTANYAGATASGLSISSGLTVANSTTSQCGGTNNVVATASTGTIAMTGGTLAPGANCTVTATVKANAAGPRENVSGFVSSTETGTNTSATGVAKATLTAVLPPVISKLFAPNPILANGTSTLTFTITNPNQNNSLSGVAFTDTFPATMVVATPATYSTSGCGAPTYTPVAGAASISFSNGTIAAAGTCYVTVNVTAPSTGTYANTSGNVSHFINAATVNGNTASDTLTVSAPHPVISILKQVSKNAAGPWTTYIPVTVGANVYYRFTLENPGDVDLASVSVTDPAFGGTVCSPGNLAKYATTTCTAGPVAAVAGFNLNTATASGTYGGTTYTDSSVAAYATIGLTIVKSATESYFTAAGNVLHYSYVVKNTGYAPLLGPVTVTDNKTTATCPAVNTAIKTASGTPGDGDNYLDGTIVPANAEQITCTATYTVTAADVTAKLVTNTASAAIDGVTSSTVSLTVPLASDLSATKANNVGGQTPVGNSFKWTLTVTNAASAGAAAFTNGQTLLTDDLPTSGATYTVPATATNAGGTAGTINCAIATNTLTCTAGGAVTIPSGGSFNITIAVATTAAGSLVNPKSGGICRADPGTVLPEINKANNDCADAVAVLSLPSITVVKSVQTYSDPINGTSGPKAIPGSEMVYTIIVTNSGAGAADNNTTVITDPISTNLSTCVSATCSNPPVTFSCSVAPACGLSYNYATGVTYSNQVGGGAPYNYTPNPDGSGYDGNVTGLRINPTGVFNGTGGGNPSFTINFKAKIK